jgi:hypothetical protein
MNRRYLKLLLIVLLFLPALACGGGDDATPTPVVIVVTPPPGQPEATAEVVPPPQPEAGIEILEATFAHGLGEEMQPEEPGADFRPDETVYLSLKIKGRPGEGLVTARFYWLDTFIAEAGLDLADANSGFIFSIGEDTYAGYTLTHEEPFPVGAGYRAEVFYGDQSLGSYPFRVIPPSEAIPTQITNVTLARDTDESYNPIDPTSTFAPADVVYLVGRGDLGIATWLQAGWYVSGQLDEAGTSSLSLEENASDVGFAFSYVPEGGWPVGEHFVVLTVNGEEIGSYTFSITE